jgi:hypothetical protein
VVYDALYKVRTGKYLMLERKLCPCCKVKMVTINYRKYGKIYYRNKCAECYRKKKKPMPPGWVKSGYRKKDRCEKCGFRFKLPEQATVFHIDGNPDNCNWVNLKTICANCQIEVSISNLGWARSGIIPDL